MSLQITPKDMLRTFMLFPLYITFFVILLLVIIFASFLPNGKILGTKLYNIFGLSGLIAAGIDLKVTGAEKIDVISELCCYLESSFYSRYIYSHHRLTRVN